MNNIRQKPKKTNLPSFYELKTDSSNRNQDTDEESPNTTQYLLNAYKLQTISWFKGFDVTDAMFTRDTFYVR